MNNFHKIRSYTVLILLTGAGLLCNNRTWAQSKETLQMLHVDPEADPEKDEPAKVDSPANDNYCCLIKKHGYARALYADLGGSDVISKVDNTTSALGLTWAVGAQLAYKIPVQNPNHRWLVSGGLELRNYNAIASSTDHLGATAYDNLHYWYAGVPLMVQRLDTRYKPGCKHPIRWYAQAGVTLGIMARVNDVYSDQGVNTTFNISQHYNTFTLQPVVSAGITYKTPGCTFLLGPFAGYTVTNLINNNGISEHIFSFGIRLTTLFLRG